MDLGKKVKKLPAMANSILWMVTVFGLGIFLWQLYSTMQREFNPYWDSQTAFRASQMADIKFTAFFCFGMIALFFLIFWLTRRRFSGVIYEDGIVAKKVRGKRKIFTFRYEEISEYFYLQNGQVILKVKNDDEKIRFTNVYTTVVGLASGGVNFLNKQVNEKMGLYYKNQLEKGESIPFLYYDVEGEYMTVAYRKKHDAKPKTLYLSKDMLQFEGKSAPFSNLSAIQIEQKKVVGAKGLSPKVPHMVIYDKQGIELWSCPIGQLSFSEVFSKLLQNHLLALQREGIRSE